MGKHLQIKGTQTSGNFLQFGTNGLGIDSGFSGSSFNVNPTLAETLASDNLTNGNNLIISNGDILDLQGSIQSSSGAVSIFASTFVEIQGGGVSNNSLSWSNASETLYQAGFGSLNFINQDANETTITTTGSFNITLNAGNIFNATTSGNSLRTVSGDTIVFNDTTDGLLEYSTNPTLTTSWGTNSLTNKGYVDSFTYFEQFTPGTVDIANVITHNLNSTKILVELWDVTNDEIISPDIVRRIDTDIIHIFFSTNPSGDVEIVIKK